MPQANPAGYSGTPLAQKLGIKPGASVLLIGEPKGLGSMLADLAPDANISSGWRSRAPMDVIVFFTTKRAELEKRLPDLRARMSPACGLWIAWPKKAAKVPTDMTEGVLREVALPTGLVDNKVCAIDEVWSGLRLVIRLKDR